MYNRFFTEKTQLLSRHLIVNDARQLLVTIHTALSSNLQILKYLLQESESNEWGQWGSTLSKEEKQFCAQQKIKFVLMKEEIKKILTTALYFDEKSLVQSIIEYGENLKKILHQAKKTEFKSTEHIYLDKSRLPILLKEFFLIQKCLKSKKQPDYTSKMLLPSKKIFRKEINNSTPPYKIPHKIHKIWIGKKLPLEYYKNLIAISQRASDYEINLWTFDEDVLRKSVAQFYDLAPSSRIKIRNIKKELYPKIKEIFLPDAARLIFTCINLESEGFSNLAIVSDILRLIILFNEGGWYMDTDIAVELKPELNLVFKQPDEKIGFYHCQQNTCFMGATQGHELLCEAIIHFLLSYENMRHEKPLDDTAASFDQNKGIWPCHKTVSLSHLSLFDIRRIPKNIVLSDKELEKRRKDPLCLEIPHKRELTIKVGVGAVVNLDPFEMKFCEPRMNKELSMEGISVVCDNTWLRQDKQLRAFDTLDCKRTSI